MRPLMSWLLVIVLGAAVGAAAAATAVDVLGGRELDAADTFTPPPRPPISEAEVDRLTHLGKQP
ncbi:hypothetical protein [Catellatospora citrea]|uniref:hypothetical protein n=1 Tax=Catellatospora citrea TaxID=53366 RepID=UPI001476C770|nr:hypothetical protein [Catellatospora citrea]